MKSLYVVSDLHIALAGRLNNFHLGNELGDFVEQIPSEQSQLVFAGDTFDLLQVDSRPNLLEWHGAVGLLQSTLEQLERERWFARFSRALTGFIARGGSIVLLPGNHDPELFHPDCETALRQCLSPGSSPEEFWVYRGAAPYSVQIEGLEIVIGHGHRSDGWNDIDPQQVHRNLESGAASQPLPAGSQLVLETINAFKRALHVGDGRPRFPFIDRLKPETPGVLLLLLYLDPVLACRHLPGVMSHGGHAMVRALRNWLFDAPALGSTQNAPESSVLLDAGRAIVEALDEDDREAPEATLRALERAIAGNSAHSESGTLAAGSAAWRSVLRAAVRELSCDRSFFQPTIAGAIDAAIIKELLPEGVTNRAVIAGHTHAAREIRLSDNRTYINTGTWTDLLSFPEEQSDSALLAWIQRLQAGKLESTRRASFAVVDANGPRLDAWALDKHPPRSTAA